MDISSFLLGVLFAFARISAFMFNLPFLKQRNIPPISKITVSLGISVVAATEMGKIPVHNTPEFVSVLVIQVLLGVTLAFVVDMVFGAAKMAGSIFDTDMGFSNASLIDPGNPGTQATFMSNLFNILFMLVFISVGGLNTLIGSIVYSFSFASRDFFLADIAFIEMLLSTLTYMFYATVQIALPLSASMFIVNFVLLLLGKMAPQTGIMYNLLIIKVVIGMILFIVCLPILGGVFTNLAETLNETFLEAMETMFTNP